MPPEILERIPFLRDKTDIVLSGLVLVLVALFLPMEEVKLVRGIGLGFVAGVDAD